MITLWRYRWLCAWWMVAGLTAYVLYLQDR